MSVQNPSCLLRSDACFQMLMSLLNPDTCVYIYSAECFVWNHNFLSFAQDKDGGPSESSQVRVGKWKVPSSQNYLALYKSLLDCDQLKVQLSSFKFCLLRYEKKLN